MKEPHLHFLNYLLGYLVPLYESLWEVEDDVSEYFITEEAPQTRKIVLKRLSLIHYN